MTNPYACTSTVAPVVPCLIGSAVLESGCLWLRLVLNQERLNPVVMPALADAIGDRGGFCWHLKALAKGLAEALKHRSGQGPDGGVQLTNGGRIERGQAGIRLRPGCCNSWSSLIRCSCGWLSFRCRLHLGLLRCQATLKTEPLPTPKTEPPQDCSGARSSEWFRPGGSGVCCCSWVL